MFKTLVILNRALNQGLQRPLLHFSLDIPFIPFGNRVRYWSTCFNRWVWTLDEDVADADVVDSKTIVECPDQVIQAQVLPLLCASIDPECLRWAALSYLADPAGPNCHLHVDADVFHSLRNTFMGACREANGNMMFSVAGAQDFKIATVALQQYYAPECCCGTAPVVYHVALGRRSPLLNKNTNRVCSLRCKWYASTTCCPGCC